MHLPTCFPTYTSIDLSKFFFPSCLFPPILIFQNSSVIFHFFSAWQYDIWSFSSKPFNGTKVLVSGWNVITQYKPPINTSFLFPAAGSTGTYACSSVWPNSVCDSIDQFPLTHLRLSYSWLICKGFSNNHPAWWPNPRNHQTSGNSVG